MNYPKSLLLIKFFLLLSLLINGGCVTSMLLDAAKSHTVHKSYRDVINQVVSAYLTPDQELIVCLRGLYEGTPPEQEYSLRVSVKEVSGRELFLSRNQVTSGCPYANAPPQTWKPVKVEISALDYDQVSFLRPITGTQETIYEQKESSGKRVIYTRHDPNLTDPWTVVELRTNSVGKLEQEDSRPFLHLLLPVAVVTDIVLTPLYVITGVAVVAFVFIPCQFDQGRCFTS